MMLSAHLSCRPEESLREPVRARHADRGALLLAGRVSEAGGVEPRAYLSEAARRVIRNPGTVTLARDLDSPES